MHPLDNEIDKDILPYVSILRDQGFNTYSSCQGAIPDKESDHSSWYPTIQIIPFDSEELVYIDRPDNSEVYAEYLRLTVFILEISLPCEVNLKMLGLEDNKILPLLELKWIVPLDWNDNDKYGPGTIIHGEWGVIEEYCDE